MDALTPDDVFTARRKQLTSSYDNWVIGRNLLPQIMRLRDGNGRYLMDVNRDAGLLMLVDIPFRVSDDEPEALYIESGL